MDGNKIYKYEMHLHTCPCSGGGADIRDHINALIEKGHTIVIVEHNMEVIDSSDWVIDLGPEAGDGGGSVVFAGTPEELQSCKLSYTGEFLKKRKQRA